MSDDDLTPPTGAAGPEGADCFGPPAEPCECYCLHCQRVFMSGGIWFQRIVNGREGLDGFWMCPTPNCDGAGFTFDIFPTDEHHPANEGWSYSDDPDDDDEDEDEPVDGEEPLATGGVEEPWDPAEPSYAEMDADHGDVEGEEWKHGLQPGERLPDSPLDAEARQAWEAEQARYDAPDERPRVLDWSNRPDRPAPPPPSSGEIGEDEIPF